MNDHSPWIDYYNKAQGNPWGASSEAQATVYKTKLVMLLGTYRGVKFDHVKIAHLGRRIAVFVVKDGQSVVLYDKTKGFPSAKLLASLVLLGSP